MGTMMQKLKSLNPFKKVTLIVNDSPIEVLFLVSKIPAPPGPEFLIPPAQLAFSAMMRPHKEITFDPGILDRGPDPPQYIYILSANNVPNLNPQHIQLDRLLVRNSAKVVILLLIGDENHQIEVEYRDGTRLKRSKSLVKPGMIYRKTKRSLQGPADGAVYIAGQLPPSPPSPPPPPPPSPPHGPLLPIDE